MANSITLDDIRDMIEQEYAPLKISITDDRGDMTYTLLPLLRVDETVRREVQERLSSLNSDNHELTEAETVDALQFVLKSVTANGHGWRLIEALGRDILMNMTLLKMWVKATQPGEALDSQG